MTVAALPYVGPYMEIGQVFERLFAWAAGRSLMGPQTRTLGIYYDDPNAIPPERCRSEACLLLPDGATPEGEAQTRIIAGGRYACIVHKGPYAELENAYRWLYHVWLPPSGEEPADQPIVEEYLNNPREHPPSEWLTEIRLLLKSETQL
jgi:AraC family transcriptional regulator